VNVSASTAAAAAPVVGVEVVGNVFVGMRDAIEIGDGSSATAHSDLKVFNNTAYRVTRAMFRVKGPVTAGKFQNNLNLDGPAMSCSTGGSLAGTTPSHNGWFGTTAHQDSCNVSCGGVDLCDATDTKGTDPLFTNPSGDNFTLQLTSAAIDKGTPVGLPFNGTVPDLGAKETGGPPPPADTTNPTVSITAPANSSTVTGNVLLTATASDDVGVVGMQFKVDGIAVGSEDTAAPFQVSWPTTYLINGPHVITAVARDQAGNTTTSSPVQVTVNNVVPDSTPPSTVTDLQSR
jgi:hypothetical protein